MSLLSRIAVEAARGFGLFAKKGGVSATYLVVAGGGGGGSNITTYNGGTGGGGAGGYQTSTFSLSTLNTYSIVVGAGGSGATAGTPAAGSNGANSVISGTGLTTVTSIGGGGGGKSGASGDEGVAGGSGGGAGASGTATVSGGAGTSGQGNNGGSSSSTLATYGAGGGGGAGAVGSNGSGNNGGNGGAGVASSISGSSVTYAGGGGGGTYGATAGTGGAGGGGNGSNSTGSSGTTNLGGGGGGGGSNIGGQSGGGSGGSGIVIISYPSSTPLFVGGTITTSGGNQIHTFTSSGTLSPITPITASYLVVAGGGGGGSGDGNGGGGGGGGGYQASSTTLYSGATYVVTVGAGGSGGSNPSSGSQGSNSIVSGTGLTTITSTGGGAGADGGSNGGNGGSGGGGGGGVATTGGTGTSGQGNNGGAGVVGGSLARPGGGGGGASAVGANGGSSPNYNGGNGGNGTASSISGTSVTYAGGGGAGTGTSSTSAGTGGTGGGGNGTKGLTTGGSGTPNTGGGGGGSGTTDGNNGGNGGAGGSGIVIISYAGSQAFNGGLVTTSGGNTIHTFTSTGALTPLTNNLNNSLRFRSSASAYLNRTPTVAGNRQKWTWSAWIKRGSLGSRQELFGASPSTGQSDTNNIFIEWRNDDTIVIDGQTQNWRQTTQVFRDPSAWYHLVLAVDTTNATANDRMKLYVNGNQITSFSTTNNPTLNSDTGINATNPHVIGKQPDGSSLYLDGYMADVYLIDGQALEPYYFGNNDANGVWKPIQYKGTYGTNGFYLTFGNTTSTTTLGYDSSPNGNNWTCNNISLTAGTTYDAMKDVPTNTSATVANYPTLNPLSNTSTLTEANLSASNILLAGTTMATPSTGKWYFEYTQTTSIPSGSLWVGVASNTSAVADNQLQGYSYASDGRKVAYNTYTSGYGATWTNGDVIGCALDLDGGTITFYKNNVSQGTAFTGITAQPYVFALSAGGAASTKGGSINCGQRPFSYTPPTGFVALNTYNLPTPTILQGNKYMDATLYTGTGTTNVAVNQGQFKPDFLWVKDRSRLANHILVDSVRGVNNLLRSESTAAEVAGSFISSLNNNGFTLSANTISDSYYTNVSGDTFVGWQWQAGQGSTSSNTQGTITTTTSVNTTAGFSVFTFTGIGASASVGHGLGVAPKFMVFKRRNSTSNWNVLTNAAGSNQYGFLDLTTAFAAAGETWTSTVINIGANFANGATYVCYAWAEIAGFSRFGSYTGNGSADGTFVFTGFMPKYVMIKQTNTTGDWQIFDTSRSPTNVASNTLYANGSFAEDSNVTNRSVDFLSNGFKIRSSGTFINASGGTFIYMAFAENPFKNSNAR